MPEPELLLLFVRPLNRAGVRHVVTGSVAVILYGEPRLTHDVDFVVFLTSRKPELAEFNLTLSRPPRRVLAKDGSSP